MSLAYVEAWFWYFRHIYKQLPLRTKPVNPAEPPPVVSQSNTSSNTAGNHIIVFIGLSLWGSIFTHFKNMLSFLSESTCFIHFFLGFSEGFDHTMLTNLGSATESTGLGFQ